MVHQDHLIAYTTIVAHMCADHNVAFPAYYRVLTLVHRTVDCRRLADNRPRSDFYPTRIGWRIDDLRFQADDGIRKNATPLPYNGRALDGCVRPDFASIPKNDICAHKSSRADFQILPELCFRVDMRSGSYIVQCYWDREIA